MSEKLISSWKKVFESDLSYVANEMKELAPAPAVIILNGEMGSGKTTFAKYFIDDGQTFSPSYSIVSESNHFLHADLDRIKGREEIIHLELPLHLEHKIYFLVEWGHKYMGALQKEVPERFTFYMLKIEQPDIASSSSSDFRNYLFYQIVD